ncbi:MAG: SDR family NAD(P)-dependent oxidoreductase [Caldithrix sp.]|nr:SDR family NAD(P)-dependent oxidoreductase [Caldithrix sp.]
MNDVQISKLAIITGASRGIGAAIARSLSENGFGVLLISRSQDNLNRISEYLQAEGGIAFTLTADVTRQDDLQKIDQFVKDSNLDLSVLIHNAGISKVGKIEAFAIEDWNQIIQSNLTAPFMLTRLLLPRMKKGNQVIFINSVAGRQSFPEWAAYNASKHGLRAFADTLREEVSERGIRVTSIFPAAVNTPLHDELNLGWDRKQMMQPADVANAVMYCIRQPSNIRINELDLSNMAGTF